MTDVIGVCHIASGDLWAGAEVQIATLLKFLARDSRLQVCAIILNPGRLAGAVEGLAIPIKVIPEAETSFLDIVREGAGFLAGRNVQVIHSHRYKENLIGAWLARRCGIPQVVRTQHGMPEPCRGFKGLKQRFIGSIDTQIARRATSRVIVVSAEMADLLGSSAERQKYVVIPNGIDLECVRSSLTAREARDRLGLSPDCPVIGVACRLEPVKRLDIFLKAAAEVLKGCPDANFVIAGEGRERAELVSLALGLGISEHVLFLGHTDRIYDVLRALDMLVISSDHEGLPMVLLEALAMGIPVVARAVGGIPEVIRNNVNGVLVESNDPMDLAEACRSLLSSGSKTNDLVAHGLRTVRDEYNAVQTAAHVTELYCSLVSPS